MSSLLIFSDGVVAWVCSDINNELVRTRTNSESSCGLVVLSPLFCIL